MDSSTVGVVNKAYQYSGEETFYVPNSYCHKKRDNTRKTKKSRDKRCRNLSKIANNIICLPKNEEFVSNIKMIRSDCDNFVNENEEVDKSDILNKVNTYTHDDDTKTIKNIYSKDNTILQNDSDKDDFTSSEEDISKDKLSSNNDNVCDEATEQEKDTNSEYYENITPKKGENIYERICEEYIEADYNAKIHCANRCTQTLSSLKENTSFIKVKDGESPRKIAREDMHVCKKDNFSKSSIFSDDNFVKSNNVIQDLGEDICYRFKGSSKSFKEKKAKWAWMGSIQREPKSLKESTPELNRSQYSLVSCGELTTGAVQLWLGLPEEVKYDPALAPFRQLYDKEYGTHTKPKANGQSVHRLPMVKSAPHINNNIQVISEEDFINGKMEKQSEKDTEEKLLETSTTQTKPTVFQKAQYITKMTLLLACWIFFTTVFLMYNEKEEVIMKSSISSGEVKYHMLNVSDPSLRILVKLSGPFLAEQAELKLNSTQTKSASKMKVYLERWTHIAGKTPTAKETLKKEYSKPWSITLQDEKDLDFNTGEKRSSILKLEAVSTNETIANLPLANQSSVFVLRIRTTSNKTVPFSLSYTLNPLDIKSGVIYACVLLVGLYVLIIFEVINRTMAAVLVSTTSLAALALAGERPTVQEVISWLDVETLILLFSMMVLVAIMAETGMFDFLAVFTFEVTKGKLWPLITTLCAITALLSTFLDNVTTVLLMTPVTIRLCEVMGLDPIPILMSMVLYSNIGGTATPVGDPPNVIIASNKAVIQAGINFTNFTLHMTLGILLVCIQTYFQLRYIYRDTNKLRLNVPRDIQDLRHQISIWRRAADSLPHLSQDQHVVRERLERKVRKLTAQLEAKVKESHKRAIPKENFQSTLHELKDKYKIRDKRLLIKSSVALIFVVAVFFLHSIPELNRVSLGWTALLGAILLLVLADREDLEPILHRVEWSTLLFFAALFVLMEALSKLGLIQYIGGLTEDLILMVDEKARLAVALLLMLWVSGLTSAFVDNIPLTTMMVRIVTSLGSNSNVNLPMVPLIWALAFGACLGGNGTLIGASANVVCAGVAEQHGYKFTFLQFFKIGFPIMIGHLLVASFYLIMCHCVFTWH